MATQALRALPGLRWQKIANVHTARGIAAVVLFFVLWQVCVLAQVPIVAKIPTPLEVAQAFGRLLPSPTYYSHWLVSFQRVFLGFLLAQLIGIPLGLLMGTRQKFFYLSFPVFEVFRPIPPLAWVPISIVFWPTAEMSIIFIIFLGAYFTVVINTINGVKAIDERYVRAALSLGASPALIFRRIIFPGALPSIFTGMAVGMGITWSVIVAAEIIAGKSGLGYMTWEAYVAGARPVIIVGMISIGVAGYVSSALVAWIGDRLMPWRRRF